MNTALKTANETHYVKILKVKFFFNLKLNTFMNICNTYEKNIAFLPHNSSVQTYNSEIKK